MVTLCTKAIEIWQTAQPNFLQLFRGNNRIPIQVELLENGINNMVCFLLVLNLVLAPQSQIRSHEQHQSSAPSTASLNKHGVHHR